jgi:hypothetical protein
MSKTAIFQLIDLDVLGNEEEGWEVNAAYNLGFTMEMNFFQYEDDEYIIEKLIEAEYLSEIAREMVEIEGDNGFLEIKNSKTGMPLYQLQMKS